MSEHSDECGRHEKEVERYEAILDTIDDVVFIVDEEWTINYANESALTQANTTLDDLRGTPVMSLADQMVVDDDVPRFEKTLEAVFADEGEFPTTVVLELDLPTGHQFGEYRFSPRYQGGDVISAVVVVRNVTESERREEKLRSLTEEYEAIFNHTEDAIFLIDVDSSESDVEFRVNRLNPVYEAITGLTNEEARGKTPKELLDDEIGTEIEAHYRRCVEGGDPITYQEELPMPEGRVITETLLAPITVEGEVTQIVGVARDITERVKQEKQSKQRDKQLRQLHKATRDLLGADSPEQVAEIASDAADDILNLPVNGIHFYDDTTDGLVPIAVSDAAQELLGEVPVIGEGIAWETFQRGEARIYDDVREAENVHDPETPMRSEIHLPLDDHGVFIVSSPEAGAFDDSDIELARTLAANTEAALERINREQELRRREAALERKNERLDEFASVVSHDLRNPLNIAQGRLELAQSDCDSEHLDDVATAHERMNELIGDLLTLARMGDSVDEVETVHLTVMVERCWRNVPTADATRVIEADRPIRADSDRLRQLFENLIRNAVEHGGKDVTVQVGTLTDGFYIEDDGPGISTDERQEVFETGYSTAPEGTGLGLNIVAEIVDAHGWNVGVTESKDGGARFEITGIEYSDS
jgi:PAS domain S-box-containing protein